VVGADVADLFNHLSGYTKQRDYRTLLVAPDTLRDGLLDMIHREARHARAGREAGIMIKMNSLVDEEIVDALYDAAAAGVAINAVIRGMCVLRPGVPGLSSTIAVRSILGRFLEHSRVLWFRNGGEDEMWMGSADAMHRNLDRRVEALAKVTDPETFAELREVLELAVSPQTSSWQLQSDGSWQRVVIDEAGERLADFQQTLLKRAANRAAEARSDTRA
jgi:polyphosphate kinase